MSFRGFTDSECGNGNPVVKLSEHFSQDQARRDVRNLPQLQRDTPVELVHEYLEDTLCRNFQTFRTDELLREVKQIETCLDRSTTEPGPVLAHKVNARGDWIPEPSFPIPATNFLGDKQISHPAYLNCSTLPPPVFLPTVQPHPQGVISVPTHSNLKPVDVTVENLKGSWDWANSEGVEGDVIDKETNDVREKTFFTPVPSVSNLGDSILGDVQRGTKPTSEIDEKLQNIRADVLESNQNLEEIQVNKPEIEASDFEPPYMAPHSKYVERLKTSQTYISEDSFEGDRDSPSSVLEHGAVTDSNHLIEETAENPGSEESVRIEENMDPEFLDIVACDWQAFEKYNFDGSNPMLELDDPFQEGLKKLEMGDFASAVLCFEAAVQLEPQKARAWQYLGTCQAANEQDIHAIAAFKECIKLEFNNLTALMALAISYTNENCGNLACITLWQWLLNNPKYSDLVVTPPPIDLDNVSAFLNPDVFKQVQDMFLTAANRNPSRNLDPDVQCGLGVLYNLIGECSKASECFKAALTADPGDARMWNRLGATLANGQRSSEAVEAYYASLDLIPGYVRARYNLGVSCINLGAHKDAMLHLLKALNQQAESKTSSGLVGTMSDSIWATVKVVLTFLGRHDLMAAVDKRELKTLNKAFAVE